MLQSSVSCEMLVFYVIITNTMAYWYDGAALAATRSPVIALFWCLIKFTTTTTTPKQILAPHFIKYVVEAMASVLPHIFKLWLR